MNLDWRLDLDRMKPLKEVFPGCTKKQCRGSDQLGCNLCKEGGSRELGEHSTKVHSPKTCPGKVVWMQINKLMAPPCTAQSKSYQGPLTMSGDSDTRHMPSLAHDAKRPRAFLKQPAHSICIFFTPSSRHVGIKPCAVFTRLRPNISLLFPSLLLAGRSRRSRFGQKTS